MPRLVKGGKHVYGWSEVGSKGMIAVPVEALEDYGLKKPCNVILFSGSVRSGGFALTNRDLLKKSHLIAISDKNPSLAEFRISEGTQPPGRNAIETDIYQCKNPLFRGFFYYRYFFSHGAGHRAPVHAR